VTDDRPNVFKETSRMITKRGNFKIQNNPGARPRGWKFVLQF